MERLHSLMGQTAETTLYLVRNGALHWGVLRAGGLARGLVPEVVSSVQVISVVPLARTP